MPTGPIQVSVLVRSANPQGKGELIKALKVRLQQAFPHVTVNIPQAFEDLAPLSHLAQQITIDITEAIDAPGMGSVSCLPTSESTDAPAKHKVEISQLLQLFLTQYQSEHFVHAKVEYPNDPYLTTIEVVEPDPAKLLFRVTCKHSADVMQDESWLTTDVDIAMDIFRHYSTGPLEPPATWVWVKTIDVPRATRNYLEFSTPHGAVDIVQHPSDMVEGDYYYAVSTLYAGQDVEKAEPAISGNFAHAVEFFLQCAHKL